MVRIEQLAEAALAGDGLRVRALAQVWLRENPHLANVQQPNVKDIRILAISASLVELFASRLNQDAPAWTKSIGALSEPVFLLKSAATMKRLRALCEAESPAPLRKRGLLAPPNYLEFA